MIKNKRQYSIAKAQMKRLEEGLEKMVRQSDEATGIHPLLRKAQEDALGGQIFEILSEINEYEELRLGNKNVIEAGSLAELPTSLIKARIASGMTQRELAEALGLKEQQIQRYEATDYANASLTRIGEVANALGVVVPFLLVVPDRELNIQSFIKRLSKIGLNREFTLKRLIPSHLSGDADNDGNRAIIGSIQTLGKIFGWQPESLLGQRPLHLNYSMVGGVRFKRSTNANERHLDAYTFYAHYLALLVDQATSHLPRMPIPTDPYEVRNAILNTYGEVNLDSCLRYVWNLGVPVIPLDDPGAFHGACFRENGRNTIVVKQRTSSPSKWMFNILHELWHAGQEPENPQRSIIEEADTLTSGSLNREEEVAGLFARTVLLGENADKLAKICVSEAGQDLRKLKSSLRRVAKRENVAIDSLAYHVAYLVSLKGGDWWATAESLQEKDQNPWQVARNVFFGFVDFGDLDGTDVELLRQALTRWKGGDNID